jgi:hypothetical protein
MGGAFDFRTKKFDCGGQAVVAKLNQVFGNPATNAYKQAQANNTFGNIQNAQDNWKDLIIAYLVAGVDVGTEFPAWVAYLEQLGAGATGPQNIYAIAQARNTALTANPPLGMDTSTNGNGGPVHTHKGSGANPTTIDSPCPP